MTRARPLHMPRMAAWLLGVWLLCGVARPVLAAVPSAAAEKDALALAHQAKARYAAKDFAEAARLFMEAYGRVPEPTLLFNAARAYEQAGRLHEALPLFQLYLSLNHDAQDADSRAGRREAEQHIATIQAELSRRKQERATPDPADRPPVPDKPVDRPPGPDKPPQEARPPQTQPLEPPPPPAAGSQVPTGKPDEPAVHRPGLFERIRPAQEDRGSYRTAALITGGTGVALVLTGALLRSLAGSDLSDLETRLDADRQTVAGRAVHPTVTQQEAQAAYSSHNSKQVIGNVFLGMGVVGIGAGVALWLLQTPSEGTAQATWLPGLRPLDGGATVTVGGQF